MKYTTGTNRGVEREERWKYDYQRICRNWEEYLRVADWECGRFNDYAFQVDVAVCGENKHGIGEREGSALSFA